MKDDMKHYYWIHKNKYYS